MTQFASAAFTGTEGQELAAADANWSKIGTSGSAYIRSNRLSWDSVGATARYKHAASPPSADYEVSCDLYIVAANSNAYNAGCLARVQSSGEISGYFGRYRYGTGWQLFRYDAGTATQLGPTVADTLTAGSTTRLRLRVSGSTISLYRGAETSPLISATDSTYASGAAGLISASIATDGPHIDNWSADTLATDASASGGTGSSTGSGSGGDAIGTAPNATAAGGTGTSSGSGSGGIAVGGTSTFTVKADGIWTWFTDPRAVCYNGYTYIGWVDSSGNAGITKWNNAAGSGTSFTLHAALEADDHDNVAIYIRPDGRILAMYSKHNDASGVRYRISTNPEDITAWGAEVVLSAGITTPCSYSNPFYLSQSGKVYDFFRSGAGGVGTNPIGMIESTDQGETWSNPQHNFLSNTGARPYVKWCSNGYDRIDFLITNCHPREGASSVYHFYGKLDVSNVLQYYKSDGTLIGSSVTPADCTLIYDGSTTDAWVWDIAYGVDGNPRCLFVKYPTTTDQRFMYSRWTGSTWIAPVEITVGGQYLYATEENYSGGLCFDALNPDHVYLSTPVSGVREIQEWATTDNGSTWSKFRDITTDTSVSVINARPYSPRNRADNIGVLFWSGTYNTFTSYSTAIKAAPASFNDGSAGGGTGTGSGSGSGGAAQGQAGTDATASGGTGTGTGSGSGGSAAGEAVATGGAGTSAGSGSGGQASGGADASGGTGAGTGSGSGGNATGQTGADGTASGGTGTSTGSGTGGGAAGQSSAAAPGGTGTSTGSGSGGTAAGGGLFTPGLCNAQIYPSRGVFYIGQAVRISAAFTDVDGVSTDPTTVTLKIRKPGSVAAETATVTRNSTGKYHSDFEIDTDGLWTWRWEGTGSCDAIDESYLRAVQSSVI